MLTLLHTSDTESHRLRKTSNFLFFELSFLPRLRSVLHQNKREGFTDWLKVFTHYPVLDSGVSHPQVDPR